jgi:hypothetical protein
MLYSTTTFVLMVVKSKVVGLAPELATTKPAL